jgi:hypothetical protein
VEVVTLFVGALVGLAIGHAVRRSHLKARDLEANSADGVPDAPIELHDDEIGHRVDGTVMVRQTSSQPVAANRLARGSIAPPFARTMTGELVLPKPRPKTPVDDGWDVPSSVEID